MSLTNEDAVNRMLSILREVETLREDAKALSDEIKDAGLSKKSIMKVARLVLKNKEQEFLDDTAEITEILEEVRGT